MSERKIIRVRDVMKPHLDFVDGLETISSALQKMQHVDTKCLIVRKRHDDDEYGMLLLSDIARHVLATDRSPERVNVIASFPIAMVPLPDTLRRLFQSASEWPWLRRLLYQITAHRQMQQGTLPFVRRS